MLAPLGAGCGHHHGGGGVTDERASFSLALDPADQLVDVVGLLNAYHDLRPDAAEPARVSFGTSGHRGSSLARTFNEARAGNAGDL